MAEIRSSASVRIFSSSLKPSDISAALGTRPSRVHEKGEKMSKRNPDSQVYRSGMWCLASPLEEGVTLLDHVNWALNFIETQPGIDTIKEVSEIDIFCYYEQGSQGGFAITPETASRLSKADVAVIFDIYCSDD
jgi:hypothetical protein